MEDLDREIEEAARRVRRNSWLARLAIAVSSGTFFLVAIGGSMLILSLFPEPAVGQSDALREEHEQQGVEPGAASIATEYLAWRWDGFRLHLKLAPVILLALFLAWRVRERLTPAE